MSPQPSRLAKRLLRLAARGDDKRFVAEDLQEEFDAMLAEGTPPGAARRWYWRQVLASVVPLMSSHGAMATSREGMGWGMEAWISDIRMAFRGLRRNPTFSVGVVLLLATGIAATTTVFAVVDAVAIRPLAYPEPEELVYVGNPAHSAADFVIWEAEISTIRTWGGPWTGEADLTEEGPPDRVGLGRVTEDYFEILGARVAQGRLFQSDEFGPDARSVVVSHRYWQRRWGSDPGLISREIRVSGTPMTVVGVLSPDFRPAGPYTGDPELWAPVDLDSLVAFGTHLASLARS